MDTSSVSEAGSDVHVAGCNNTVVGGHAHITGDDNVIINVASKAGMFAAVTGDGNVLESDAVGVDALGGAGFVVTGDGNSVVGFTTYSEAVFDNADDNTVRNTSVSALSVVASSGNVVVGSNFTGNLAFHSATNNSLRNDHGRNWMLGDQYSPGDPDSNVLESNSVRGARRARASVDRPDSRAAAAGGRGELVRRPQRAAPQQRV